MDQSLLQQVDAVLVVSEAKLTEFENLLVDAEAMTKKVEDVANRIEKIAAVLADMDMSQRADLYVETSLSGLMDKLDEVEDKLGPAAFHLEWDEEAIASAEEGAIQIATEVVEAAAGTIGQVQNLTEQATEKIINAMQDIGEKFGDLVDKASEASERTEQAQEQLLALLETNIPDLGDLVNELVGAAFSERLKEMTQDIDAVLEKVEAFVDAATSEVVDRLAGVSETLQVVNDIVQPLEPAFDAFEILN